MTEPTEGLVACRRCHRMNPADAAKCSYCNLPNPASGPTGVGADGKSRNPLYVFRYYFGSAALVVVLVVAWGVVRLTRSAPAAPACDDAKISGAVADLLHENAVYELSPDAAARFPRAVFATFTGVESAQAASADHRSCKAVLTMVFDAMTTAAVEKLVAKPPATATPATKTLLASAWHASAQRLELPIRYGIVAGKDASSPWDLSADPGSVSSLRDVVRLVAWSATGKD